MKKIFSCIMIVIATLVSLCACSKQENKMPDDEDYPVISNIALDIYGENYVLQETLKNTTDNHISLCVGTVYIFEIYLYPANGAIVFTDDAIQFNFDSDYIKIVDCDLEDEINHSFYFAGLQVAESTVLTVSISAATSPKEISIALTT